MGMLGILLGSLEAKVFHVTPAAFNDDADGPSWANPAGLKAAFDAAQAGDEIWIKKGIYFPSLSFDQDETLNVGWGVKVYGGFCGNETARNQRNIEAHRTILTGDLHLDDISTNGVTTNANGINGNNSHHILTVEDAASVVLDGLTITGGSSETSGGGLNINNASVTIVNCRFIGNRAETNGGAILAKYSGITMRDCFLQGNHAGLWGGALYHSESEHSPQSTFTNCEVRENSATQYGGGLFFISDSNREPSFEVGPKVVNCVISGNTADDEGGGFVSLNCHASMLNSTVTGNWAAGDTAGAIFQGGAVQLHNSILWGNQSASLPDGLVENYENSGFGDVDHPEDDDVSYSLIEHVSATALGGLGNLDGTLESNDPLFFIPLNALAAPSTSGNFRLKPDSPAINAGSNAINSSATDINGIGRVLDGTIDLGATENSFLDQSNTAVSELAYSNQLGTTIDDAIDFEAIFTNLGSPDEIILISNSNHQVVTPKIDVEHDSGDGDCPVPYTNYPGTVDLTIDGYGVSILTFAVYDGADIGYFQLTVDSRGIVTTLSDWVSGSLRDVVLNSSSGVYITFSPDLDGGTIPLIAIPIIIAHDTTIDASSLGSRIAISGFENQRVFEASDVALKFIGLKIMDGDPDTENTGGGLYASNCHVTLEDCVFENNEVSELFGSGGALYVHQSTFSINRCLFHGNAASFTGGAIGISQSTGAIDNSAMAGNLSLTGGALTLGSNSAPILTNVTIQGNRATDSGGGVTDFGGGSAVFRNCIIWNNQADGQTNTESASISNIDSTAFVSSLVENVTLDESNGNLPSSGPVFVNATDPATAPTTVGNLQLLVDSPAVHAGSNSYNTATTDLAGNPRITGSSIDLGAYETSIISSLTVMNTNDSGADSLRDVISRATDETVINFAIPLDGQTITLSSDSLSFSKSVVIDASSLSNGITINGAGAHRVFNLSGEKKIGLSGLTITNGGGGTLAEDVSLVLDQCTFRSHQSTALILSSVTHTINNCVFENNNSNSGGALLTYDSEGTFTNCLFAGNQAAQSGG